ncbi:hypothetical protein [Ancylobacter lacus]|uniref:hypothetical protein n=1 Tax=Ancylobacter lacus TaxID=2579970 RepID=UPI001BCAA95B|nr:hypothetical protein [Ancylobacter lacus]MBS7540973.1 hypothetical protein [Ancylobacter lacus]
MAGIMRTFSKKVSKLWRPVERRLKPHVDRWTGKTERRQRARQSALEEQIPAFLAAVRTVKAFGFELSGVRRDVAALKAENEALRAEIEALKNAVAGTAGGPAPHADPDLPGRRFEVRNLSQKAS